MNLWCTSLLCAVVAAGADMVGAVPANADDYIDFGMNQAACKSAANQANAAGSRHSYCYETGPGHYTLYLAD